MKTIKKKRSLINSFILNIAITAIFVSCSSQVNDLPELPQEPIAEETSSNVTKERKEITLTAEQQNTLAQLEPFNIKFTTDMCKFIDSDMKSKGQNVICSPVSTVSILSMVANAVDNKGAQQIVEYLNVSDLSSLLSLNKLLLETLPLADNTATLTIANSLWYNNGLVKNLTPTFTTIFENYFNGQIHQSNFSLENTETLNNINEWGSRISNNQITSYLSELEPNLYAIILNGLNFSGKWHDEPFNPQNTKKGVFHGHKKDSEVEFMHSELISDYSSGDETFLYYVLPYGNQAFSLHIFFPRNPQADISVFELLTQDRIKKMRENFSLADHKYIFPKFSLTSDVDLTKFFSYSNVLNSLSNQTTFTLFDEEIQGGIKFSQKTAMTVNETGTTVSAISSGEFGYLANEEDPQEVLLNRPFFFFIQEYSTNTIILSGRISEF